MKGDFSMKLLHIASFRGNLGDIISQEGFYSGILHNKVDIDKLEIRRFYRNCNEAKFDNDLLHYINKYDGLILGGGCFFDVYWDDSCTGTTFDMSKEFVDAISVPVLVNAMGVSYIDYEKVEAKKRFLSFITYVQKKDNWMLALRNDGSYSRLKSMVEGSIPSIMVVPDNGFAFVKHEYKSSNLIGLSITNDLFDENIMKKSEFNEYMKELCNIILGMGHDICFFLHTPQDIGVLYDLYARLGCEKFRNRIKIAPYDVSTLDNAVMIDKLYSNCRYIISMRFHGNVIAIKNGIPVIGLAGHEQIYSFYNELNLQNWCVIVKDGFFEKLITLIKKMENELTLKEYSYIENQVMTNIAAAQTDYSARIAQFFGL